jgi:hypothetical protein
MFVSILGTHPQCGENALVTVKLGEILPAGFEAKRVVAAAPTEIEALMQGTAAASNVSPHRETMNALRAQARAPRIAAEG